MRHRGRGRGRTLPILYIDRLACHFISQYLWAVDVAAVDDEHLVSAAQASHHLGEFGEGEGGAGHGGGAADVAIGHKDVAVALWTPLWIREGGRGERQEGGVDWYGGWALGQGSGRSKTEE